MAALPIVSGAECIAKLAAWGYCSVRQKGSHVRLKCEGRLPVTVPLHSTLDRGTLHSILRDSGLTVAEFLEGPR